MVAFDQFADMRLGVQFLGRQIPDMAIGRIGQAQPPIRGKNSDPFIEIVQGLAMNGKRGLVGALQAPKRW